MENLSSLSNDSDYDEHEVLTDSDSTIESEVLTSDSEEALTFPVATSSGNESKEEGGEEDENSKECQTEKVTCAICYKDLYVGNSVTTTCNHSYCNTCFFRWMEVNTQCPLCRTPVDSKANLSDEQLLREHTEVYKCYRNYLIENVDLYREQQRISSNILSLKQEYYKLKYSTDALISRQISLREMIENTRGHNEGQLAAIHNLKKNANKEEYSSLIFQTMRKNTHFISGFMKGLEKEDEKLKVFQKIILNELDEKMMDIDYK